MNAEHSGEPMRKNKGHPRLWRWPFLRLSPKGEGSS